MKKIIIGLLMMFSMLNMVTGFGINFGGLGDVFKRKLVGVHFKGGGNDFGGMLFVKDLKDISSNPEDVYNGSGGVVRKCEQKLKGYYYNTQHGQILYPLEEETLEYRRSTDSEYYKDLEIEGGMYTLCDGDEDSVYGQIIYKKSGKEIYSIQAGFKYESEDNKIKEGWEYADNLQFLDSEGVKNIVGLIYDSSFGIGFVGGRVEEGFEDIVEELNNRKVKEVITGIGEDSIENTVGASIMPIYGVGIDTKIVVRGYMGIGNRSMKEHKLLKQFVDMNEKRGANTIKGQVVTINRYINKLNKNTEILCQGRWNKTRNASDVLDRIDIDDIGSTVCIKGDDKVVYVTEDVTSERKATNVIIKGERNKVIIQKSQQGPGNLNIYVNKGYVMLDNDIDLVSIDKKGNITEEGGVTSGAVLNGNIYVNGLIGGGEGENINVFNHKMYIYGSLISLNTVGKEENRNKYVGGIGMDRGFVNMMDIFKWECMGERGTDGVKCGDEEDNYAFNSLIIKKKNFKENILLR